MPELTPVPSTRTGTVNAPAKSHEGGETLHFPLTPAAKFRQEISAAAQLRKEAMLQRFIPGGIPSQVPTLQRKPSSNGLPIDLLQGISAQSGHDLSDVNVHRNSEKPAQVGALAYAQGNDIHLAAGQEQHLAHEAAHVVQQREGRVQPNTQVAGLPVNDNPQLEKEADTMAEVVQRMPVKDLGGAAGENPPTMQHKVAAPQPLAEPLQRKKGSDEEDEEETETVVQGKFQHIGELGFPQTYSGPIQWKVSQPGQEVMQRQVIQKKDPEEPYIVKYVVVTKEMTPAEFMQLATASIFGGNPPAHKWEKVQASYVPANSPYKVLVAVSLFKKMRGANNNEKGIPSTATGDIDGAAGRSKAFLGGANTKEKSELMAEIDRRYYEAAGVKPGEKITGSEADKGKAALWRQIQDEVLFQNEYIQNLPAEVKKLIKFSKGGKKLEASDIEQFFRIAKKIERMDTAKILDYAAKINATTTDLDAFEKSVDAYIQQEKERKLANDERITAQDKLAGNEDIYTLYKEWKKPYRPSFPSRDGFGVRDPNYDRAVENEYARREKQLLDALHKKGFDSIAQYELYLTQFRLGFQKEAVNMLLDILAKYEGTLYQESERYKDPKELQVLYDSLAPFRQKFAELQAVVPDAVSKANEIERKKEIGRRPGNGGAGPTAAEKAEADAAAAKAWKARDDAKAEVTKITPKHPLLGEDHLDPKRRIDKTQLAAADISSLGPLVQAHIAVRIQDVKDARARLLAEPEMIFEMPKMLDQFYAAQGIVKGGVPYQIIEDKITQIKNKSLFVSIVLGILALALAVVSFGAATPWIAGAAAAGGIAISAYSVYDEYHKYTVQHDLAAVGFVDDPNIIWLIIAVVGATVDLGAAAKAMGAIGSKTALISSKAALLSETGVDDFAKALQLLKDQGKIDAKVALAAENAARSRKLYEAAADDLAKIISGKLSAPDVYKALVKMAKAKASQIGNTFEVWLGELNKMRIDAKLAKLSDEEVELARTAWKEAKALEAALANVDELVKTARTNVLARIGDSTEFALKYTEPELKEIFRRGLENGLSPKQIEDFIFVGSRVKKELPASEVLSQIDTYVGKVLKEGLPTVFEDAAKYAGFKAEIKSLLSKYGVPNGKVKVQGSSLRTVNAKDIDLAVFVSQSEFDAMVKGIRADILMRNVDKPHVAANMIKQLEKQIAQGRISSNMFEFKGGVKFAAELYPLRAKFLSDPTKGIDLSVMLDNGKFNVSPFLDF